MEYIISLLVLQSVAIIYLLFRKREIKEVKEVRVEEKEYTVKYVIPDYKKVDVVYNPTSIKADNEIVSKVLLSLTEEYDLWDKQTGSLGSLILERNKYRLYIGIDRQYKITHISLSVGGKIDIPFNEEFFKHFQYIVDTTYVEMKNEESKKKCESVNEIKDKMLKDILSPEKLRLYKLNELEDGNS